MQETVQKFTDQIEQYKNESELFRKERSGEIHHKINYFLQNMFIASKWLKEDTERKINNLEEIKELSDINKAELVAIAAICHELLKEKDD